MVGILAFGSLINDPGSEIGPAIVDRRCVPTPFRVEFARYSGSRDGAPTLVPVDHGGAQVGATLLILAEEVSLQAARDMLWRRETQQIGSGRQYREEDRPSPSKVLVRELRAFEGVDIVLYVDFPTGGKVESPTPDELADKAISSIKTRKDGNDGLSYLLHAKDAGIVTPLMPEYEKRILEKTGAKSLREAIERLRRA